MVYGEVTVLQGTFWVGGELQSHTFSRQNDIFHGQGEAAANDFPNAALLSGSLCCSLVGAELAGRWRAVMRTG